MDPYRERMAAFDTHWQQVRRFRDRPFPHDWAKVVNGVGLVSFAMRVERSLGELSHLGQWNPTYVYASGKAQEFVAELHRFVSEFDQFLPALPPEPRGYFEDFRSLVVEAIALTDAWWASAAASGPALEE